MATVQRAVNVQTVQENIRDVLRLHGTATRSHVLSGRPHLNGCGDLIDRAFTAMVDGSELGCIRFQERGRGNPVYWSARHTPQVALMWLGNGVITTWEYDHLMQRYAANVKRSGVNVYEAIIKVEAARRMAAIEATKGDFGAAMLQLAKTLREEADRVEALGDTVSLTALVQSRHG